MSRKTERRFLVKFSLSLLLLLLLPFSWAVPQGITISDEVKQSARDRMAAGEAVGLVIGIIDGEGRRQYFSAGTTGLEGGTPVDEFSVYEMGSISKVFTCTVLAEMVLAGTIRLSDPVEKYVPDDVKIPSRNNVKITLEHIATHRSSLPRMPSNFQPGNPLNPYADYTVQNMFDFLNGYALTRDIGAKYEYSNLAMGLLGQVLALKDGMSFEAMIKKRICQPLGMSSTVITLTPQLMKKLAKPHNRRGEVSLWDIPALAGAGAIRSTCRDMLVFLEANIGLKKTALLEAMEMTHKPRVDAVAGMKVGLAWHIRDNGDTKIVWHNGGTGGYRAFAGFVKDKKIGAVVLSNMNVSADDIGFHLLDNSYPLKAVEKSVKK